MQLNKQKYYAFVRAFSIMRAEGASLIAIEEVRNCRKIACIKNIFENDWWQDAYPTSYSPGSGPGHRPKLRKPSKESGIFQRIGTICFAVFY